MHACSTEFLLLVSVLAFSNEPASLLMEVKMSFCSVILNA